VQTLSLEVSRKGGLEQKGAHGLDRGANHTLNLAVLGGVGSRHP
jgi:hypothetical protein